MNWIETKYINLLSLRLNKFKKVHDNYNFRCPICKDSQKNQNKARGWILTDSNPARYFCHNCNATMKFHKFLKLVDVNLYYDYVTEAFKEPLEELPKTDTQFKTEKPKFFKLDLKKISQLRYDHPAKRYVEKRMLPTISHYRLYYAPKFKAWVNTLIPNKFDSLDHDEPRLIIPFFDWDGTFFGFQGRSFDSKSNSKYITIILDDKKPKVYGLDKYELNKTAYVVEGPLDSMFLPNALASCGGRLETSMKFLDKANTILIYDNEPRSKETIKKLKLAIAEGYIVCIWPNNISEKDINNLVIKGFTSEQILDIINSNSFSGLEAELKLAEWDKT